MESATPLLDAMASFLVPGRRGFAHDPEDAPTLTIPVEIPFASLPLPLMPLSVVVVRL